MSLKHLFFSDYLEGAHPRILQALSSNNLQQEKGYGLDRFSLEAADLVRDRIGNRDAAVHFVHSGGMANLVALGSMLKPYESIIAPASAHIHVHEGGAIEAAGHKINLVQSFDGKLTPGDIAAVMDKHIADEQMVLPKVVALTHATEVGTIYWRDEIEQIAKVCRKYDLYLFLDGARLASALASEDADIQLPGLSGLLDMFYIGGTKNGALLGEAIVINNPALQTQFRRHMRRRAAYVAKARLIGIQFVELLRDGLYLELARHANRMAKKLRQGIAAQGYRFLSESSSNLSFPIFPNEIIGRLQANYGFHAGARVDAGMSAVRLVTSWATPEQAVDDFVADLKAM
jgi:threonine aldolase